MTFTEKVKSLAASAADEIRNKPISESAWIDGIELRRINEETGLELLGDKTSMGRADGGYLQNLLKQCDRDEATRVRLAVNRLLLPANVEREVAAINRDRGCGLTASEIPFVALAVIETFGQRVFAR